MPLSSDFVSSGFIRLERNSDWFDFSQTLSYWMISFIEGKAHHGIMRIQSVIENSPFFFFGKDYSGAKFFYTEPIPLNKAHSTK